MVAMALAEHNTWTAHRSFTSIWFTNWNRRRPSDGFLFWVKAQVNTLSFMFAHLEVDDL
jgi:hypothetical protein